MSLNAKKVQAPKGSGPKQDPIEPGTYPCRVVQVLDMGVQKQKPYKGQEKDPAHEIMMTYEFLDEFCLDENGEELEDKPRWLSETFPLRSLESDLAKSTKRYNAIDPEDAADGDFTKLVGSPCMVTITQREAGDKVYTNISGVATMRPKEAKKAPELVNPAKVFLLDEPDLEVFGSLPQWVQDKIKGNLDFDGSALEEALEGGESKPKSKPKAKKVEEKEEKPPFDTEDVDDSEDGEDDEEW